MEKSVIEKINQMKKDGFTKTKTIIMNGQDTLVAYSDNSNQLIVINEDVKKLLQETT